MFEVSDGQLISHFNFLNSKGKQGEQLRLVDRAIDGMKCVSKKMPYFVVGSLCITLTAGVLTAHADYKNLAMKDTHVSEAIVTGSRMDNFVMNKSIIKNSQFSQVAGLNWHVDDSSFINNEFTEAQIRFGSFQNVRFNGDDFHGANLEYARFENCIFENVNFEDADLTGVFFKNCKINGTMLNSEQVSQIGISNCVVDGETVFSIQEEMGANGSQTSSSFAQACLKIESHSVKMAESTSAHERIAGDREVIREMYYALKEFSDSSDFHSLGFTSPQAQQWLEKLNAISLELNLSAEDYPVELAEAPGYLRILAEEYKISGGFDTEDTLGYKDLIKDALYGVDRFIIDQDYQPSP